MDLAAQFARHLTERLDALEEALGLTGFDALVVGSGAPYVHFRDDQPAPFQPVGHFVHYCPLEGPHHLLRLTPAQRPLLVRWAPEDYWYEQGGLGEPFWLAGFDLAEVVEPDAAWKQLGSLRHAAYIGNEPEAAHAVGLVPNPEPLLARLDWGRAYKTDYELSALADAQALAARGHRAAQEAFKSGASELEVHQAFMRGLGQTEDRLPYPTIIGMNEKSAILHYEHKRLKNGGRVMLIDAGARVRGYASDITRTHLAPSCDARFAALRDGLETVQQRLCQEVRPGVPFTRLHERAHLLIGGLLAEHGVVKTTGEEAVARGLTQPFFPHGLGHHLGIQVHDVGGHLAGPDGTPAPPPPAHPFLRNTRTIEPCQVFTIEPGVYFIPMLLRPLRQGADAQLLNWELIDALAPLGGIRIEDNVVVTEDGHRNLTREQLPS